MIWNKKIFFWYQTIWTGVVKLSLWFGWIVSEQFDVEQIGSREWLGEIGGKLFSGNFGKSSKRPSQKGRWGWQRYMEWRLHLHKNQTENSQNLVYVQISVRLLVWSRTQDRKYHISKTNSNSKPVHDGTFWHSILGYIGDCRLSLYTSSPPIFCACDWTQSWLNPAAAAAAARQQILIDPKTRGALFTSHYRKLIDVSIQNFYPV